MKYAGKRTGTGKIAVPQGFKQCAWIVNRRKFFEHMLSYAFEHLPDPAGLRKVLLVIDSGKLPEKRFCLVCY